MRRLWAVSYTHLTVSGVQRVGVLVGLNDGKTDTDTLFSISSSVNKGTFDGTVVGDYKVGGLVGDNEGTVTKGEDVYKRQAFQKDKTNLNNGYPILDWQYIDPAATCTVKFNVNP